MFYHQVVGENLKQQYLNYKDMDAENINYLVGKIRTLEKKNGRLRQQIDAGHESFRVHRKEIEELEFQLKHKIEVIKELETIINTQKNNPLND